MTASTRLRIFAFPQHWSGSELSLRVLVAPSGNPLQPLDPGLTPFAQARLALSAQLIPSLDRLPQLTDVTASVLLDAQTPSGIMQLYNEVATVFNVDPTAPPAYVAPTNTRFLKMVMPSYLETTGVPPRTEYAVTDNRYICAVADGERPNRPPVPRHPPKWDALLAMAIRQPILAEQLGLIYATSGDADQHALSVTPPDANMFADGGWLFVTLDSTSDYFTAAATADFLKLYAARIPPLKAGEPAPVFAAVLFPVRGVPPAGSFDEILHEAERYVDGFARLVHTFQPDRADYLNLSGQGDRRPALYEETGLKLGWDDEQVVIWLNRQLSDDPRNGAPTARDTPMGVRGFRIDVRDVDGADTWASLVRMQGTLRVGDVDLGEFDGEMAFELAPSQLQGKRDGDYWLPPYFTTWTGTSIIATDETAFKVSNATKPVRVLTPVAHRDVPLKYGKRYQFRVRLTDLTGGGPGSEADSGPPETLTMCRFRRFIPPGRPTVDPPEEEDVEPNSFFIRRPVLGYPAVLFTELPDAEEQLLADVPVAVQADRPPGIPDPDVAFLRIDVTVATLEYDPRNLDGPQPRQRLYSCFRAFPDELEEPYELSFDFEDTNDLSGFPAPTAHGPIKLPTARTVEVYVTPIARRDPGMPAGLADPLAADVVDLSQLDAEQPTFEYFGKHAARVGKHHSLTLRGEAAREANLFATIPGVPFQGIFIRPDPPYDVRLQDVNAASGDQQQTPQNAVHRCARQLRLVSRDLTLSEDAGARAVFGASAAIRHVLSPDHSTITFADITELTSRWLMVVPLVLRRDWTWDGLADEGLQVVRSIDGAAPTIVGTITPRRALSETTLRSGVAIDRSQTRLFFFDAIDPQPPPGEFPREIDVTYTVVPQWRTPPQAPTPQWSSSITLPMAARPTQVPQIVSAGIALSPYERDATYSQTLPRRRMLWVEFAEPVANPRDGYFARATMHAADPMLIDNEPSTPPGPLEPPINIDPEPIRSIVSNQTPDSSGLEGMQRLIPADGMTPSRHFLVPLPEAMSEASPELFGFFVYEFAVGHAKGWSTAQARYGLVQRVTGVQHPTPSLTCSILRIPDHIRISAPFARAAAGGRVIRSEPPRSELWALLYVQVQLADRSDWRNILIGRTRLRFSEQHIRDRIGAGPQGTGYYDQDQIDQWLDVFGLPRNSPLSVVAIEMLPEIDSPFGDPLGKDLGQVRVLRVSPLTPVPSICLDT
jgi:hypothetical protein